MAYDDLPVEPPITPPTPPETPTPPEMETRDVLDSDSQIIGSVSLPVGTSEEIWTETLGHYLYVIPPLTVEQQLVERMEWGKTVITQFRVYSMGIDDQSGLELLGNMMDVKSCLELGMLAASAGLLASKDSNDLLDTQFSESDPRSVRQRFIEMILNEGPAP